VNDVLEELAGILEARKNGPPASSYTATLYAGGVDAILKKIGEEASELIIAAKAGEKNAIIHETADVWFHTLVLLAHLDLSPDDVLAELERRLGRSGLEEKASRKAK